MRLHRVLPLQHPLRLRRGSVTTARFSNVRHPVSTYGLHINYLKSITSPYARTQIARSSTVRNSSGIGNLFRSSVLAAIAIATGAFSGVVIGWGCNTWLYMQWGKETAKNGMNVAPRPALSLGFLGQNATNEEYVLHNTWREVEPDELVEIKSRNNAEGKSIRPKHLTYETLSVDKQELTTRGYVNVDRPSTLLVFMADYGVEGWPRVVHGGITTSLIYDALKLHMKHSPDLVMSDNVQVDLNYRRPIDTRKTYVVSLETRLQDPAGGVSGKPYVSQLIDVKVREMQHFVESSDSSSQPKTANVEGTALMLLSTAEQNPRRANAKTRDQNEKWIREYNKSWKEQQQKKLDSKSTKPESRNQ